MAGVASVEEMVRACRRAGWRVRQGKHWVAYPPEGRVVVFACTPGDQRALRNISARLRKAGLEEAKRRR